MNNVAVLCDVTNIRAQMPRSLNYGACLKFFSDVGEMRYVRAYMLKQDKLEHVLSSCGFDLIVRKKEKIDFTVLLAIDAMKIINDVQTYIIMSNNCNVMPLAAELAQQGKCVVFFNAVESEFIQKLTEKYPKDVYFIRIPLECYNELHD